MTKAEVELVPTSTVALKTYTALKPLNRCSRDFASCQGHEMCLRLTQGTWYKIHIFDLGLP
jgi:uncharacterized protein (UPF0179 family)